MFQRNSLFTTLILLCLSAEFSNGQTCSYMWDPIFETQTANPPTMCAVSTTSGSTCVFPFNYGGVTYTTCTIQGPNNGNNRPQCATAVNSNNTATAWGFCAVPNDAVVSYATVRKAGSWNQQSGSTQGGTLIWIYGNRFAENSFSSTPSSSSSNTVQLVDGFNVYDCEMHNDKTTTTQLTCYAPVLPESIYQIRVYVNGYLIPLYQYINPNRALFIPSSSQTPTITGIKPQSGTPNSLITLSGSFETSCYSRDVDGCSQDNNALISRIYIGGQLCNLMNPATGDVYSNVSESSLQCNFDGTEVGVFNISMLVTNEYGRSLTSSSLYRVSGDEEIYTFQSYAVVSSISPSSGSTAGGTTVTINGNYFDDSTQYPLVVKVGNQPCTILSSTTTTIQCQTPVQPSSSQSQYQGSRGLQLYVSSGFTAQGTLSGANPPSPTGNASSTDDALYVSTNANAETAWLVGFIRVKKTAHYTFNLITNGVGALFFSTDDSPANKQLIATATSNQTTDVLLNNNTNYYLLAIGSRSSGSLRFGVRARMQETTLTGSVASSVLNEIQRIAVTATVQAEQQQIAVTTNAATGTAEVQTVLVDVSTFQIGFRGVYTGIFTGRPTAAAIQTALNDLPTVYPLTVTVSATSTLYTITFPVEMGDVPLLTCISSSVNVPVVTETTQGVASQTKVAFELDGQLSDFVDLTTANQTQLKNTLNKMFGIRCPSSINIQQATPGIVYAQDYETNCVYDATSVTTNAFCGQCSYNGNSLISGNSQPANYLCFAYRILNNFVISLGIGAQLNGDTTSTYWYSIPFSPQADQIWHYICIDVRSQLISQSSISSSVSSITITNAWLSNYVKKGIYLDAVTLRTSLPTGYEPTTQYPVDQSANSSCVFPFTYNGQSYTACTLDNNNLPVCADQNGAVYQCRVSSIEGVRRLYPKHQLVYNTLSVSYPSASSPVTVNFRYSDCTSPALFSTWPSSVGTTTQVQAASNAASGTYSLVFNGQTYASIPVDSSAADLAARLQSSSDFGYVNVKRLGDCTGYSYTIEWISIGGQKTPITITNANAVTPAGTTVSASIVQSGGVVFSPVTGDLTRTYHTLPQVEVLVGGYPSKCIGDNTCDYQWLSSQTPTVTNIVQSSSTLTITGTGFSTTASDNKVTIGTSGTCTVTSASSTSLICTISAAPAGTYAITVNILGKGLATGTSSYTATVSLQVTSISPVQGGAGGGYQLNVTGTGFSQSSTVTVDGSLCTDSIFVSFSSITCTVPPTSALTNTQVDVVVTSGSSSSTLSNAFTYNVANTPSITSSSPNVVTMSGGQIQIQGTGFGTTSVVVYVGTAKATIKTLTSTSILADLPSLAPGLYPVRVSTANGYARPALQIEYQFYVQSVSPQVGSLYGGSRVFVQGQGFDNSTTISFTDGSNDVACIVKSAQSNQIECETQAAAPQVIISSNGVDPTYGSGFSWSPQLATVQQGAVVQWQWGGSELLQTLRYKVVQVSNGYDTTAVSGGFDSGVATASGSFSYQFDTIGTYYYYTPAVDSSGLIPMRGVINVVAAQPRTLTVKATSNSFTAQSCVFPFTFNSQQYTACTTVNDTQSWCSPSATYTGQRLYCTSTATIPTSSCVSSALINPTSCSQTVPTDVRQFLFTSCTLGQVSSVSPLSGPSGTSITITGTGFSTTQCENVVLIGSSYQCPITSASTTQLVCQIAANSQLNAKSIQNVNVAQDRQGLLQNAGLVQFQFQAQISSITPIQGSVLGGTLVTINGDGFVPEDTRVIVGSIEYTSLATITYSQIQFQTEVPPASYIGQPITVTVLVGTNQAVCSASSCNYKWLQNATPSLTSVSPTSITGPTTLTLTGQNFDAAGSVTASDVTVLINDQSCTVTSATSTSISCNIGNLVAGTYSVVVSINDVGTVQSSASLTSVATVSSVSPTSGSTNGGVLLTVNGNGFATSPSNIQVKVGSSQCTIVSTTAGQVTCTVPAKGSNPSTSAVTVISNSVTFTSSATFTYDSSVSPSVTSISPVSGTSGQALVITGTNFVNGQTSVTVGGNPCSVSTVSTTSITCTVGSSSAGNQAVVVSVTNVGQSNSDVTFLYTLQISSISPSRGSYGGGQSVTINGDGLNSSSVSVTVCGVACQSVNALSNTQLVCVTPSATFSSSDTPCSLTVTIGSLTASASYVYGANVTATVSSINPLRGGTGGGTTLTITGSNFPSSVNDVTVSIAGVSCNVQSISSTTITCLTGSYDQTTVQAIVQVNLVNGGNAISSSQYQYIDLWSSPWTWGGSSPPEEGTIVSIDSGKTVYFDTTTPILKAVIVDNASLIFDDSQNVALNAEYILVVNGGRLQVGTASNPFQHNAIITMYGHLRSIELPIFGAKVLALRDGTVDMHGQNVVRTWTRLGATATAGSSTITLLQPVDWPVGSQIVIATTGDHLSQGETETRIITGISNNNLTLTLDSPLTYQHLGITRTISGSTTVEFRAEVGLLSHNVVFQGSTTATWNQTIEACPEGFNPGEFAVQTCFLGRYGQEIGSDQFGATLMVSPSADSSDGIQRAIVRLSNIEVFNAGQAFRLGRYPVHFHMNANMSQSYVRSVSIHQTFNRAVNIHATHYLTVENIVIYNIMGGAIFLEDGVEIGNVLRGNLAVFVRTSSSLLNEDVTPAAFWVTNPNNIVENNAVAGGTHFGFWYRMLRTPDGPSYAMYSNYCPHRQFFGRFANNTVHSVGRFGVWVFPEYSPTVAGSCSGDQPYQAVFDGLVSWGNNRGFEWVMSSTVKVQNFLVYDNADTGIRCVTAINNQATNLPNLRATFYNENAGSSVVNAVIIGDTGVFSNRIVPGEGGLVVMWDRGLRVRNVSFYNFPSSQTQAIFGPVITGRCSVKCGGWLTKFSQLSFTNVANRGNFRWVYDGVYQDEDGTLSGRANSILIAPDGLWNGTSACTVTSNFVNSITCPATMGSWIRFAFNQANLGRNGEALNIYDTSNHHTVVPNLQKRLTHPMGYMMNLLAKNTYLFQFENANSSVNLSYSGVAYSLAPGDYLIIQHQVAYMPDQVYTISSAVMTTPSSAQLSASSNNGDWYYDNSTNIFSYIVKNPSSNTLTTDVTVTLNVIKCRYVGCQPPTQPALEIPATSRPATALYWSNDSHWTFVPSGYGGSNGVKPVDNTHIYVPRGVWLVVDYPLPIIRSLRLEGVLEFEQGMNNILNAESIFINGGRLIAGWPNNPLTGNVDIVITGSSSTNVLLPNDAGSMGPKVIGVFGGLDLNGIPRNVSWTRLSTTAAAGQTQITLAQPVDWVVGDEIVLTTTDTRINHTERRTIANITGPTVTLTSPLTYSHSVIHNVFPNGEIYHVAGAVGLLSHNVRVINRSPASERFGFRILVTDYETNVWNEGSSEWLRMYYKGYARISNTQFIGFGQFVDAPNEDKREGVHIYNLGDYSTTRPTYINSCSFDTGYYSAIGIWDSNGIPITNNVVYNTFESAIVVIGKNNLLDGNLVTTVYWSGQAQPAYAEFNTNYDGAIMSRDAESVIIRNNLVAGVQRIAYRIQGNSCPGTVLPANITNDYSNNEAHSTMAGVVIWPQDPGFQYDTNCILIKGFKTYKTWYFGLYINTQRNIIIDSCSIADSTLGILPFRQSISPLGHQASNPTITIRNSIVIGDITQDCTDVPDNSTLSETYGTKVIPRVYAATSSDAPTGRAGISFPYFSGDNMIPRHPWTGIGTYPAIDGLMTITNVTAGFFNTVCSRRDVLIAVSQNNDDGQHPVVTSSLSIYNSLSSNLILNGRPNLGAVNPSDCVDMDCDGLKKALLTDTDGTLFGQPSSAFSQAEYNWGSQPHGIGDYRIPKVALADQNGLQININLTYPYRGISRAASCSYQASYQMYVCPNTTDYRMLIIESMDSDTETRRLSPVAVMSDSGYLDLINGPQDHGWCNGYTCQKRISTFMSIIESGHHYNIYLTSTTPNHMRFRLLNSNANIKSSLALYYQSLQQIDVYANNIYQAPTNKNTSFVNTLILTDAANGVTLSSPAGTNYFNRTTQLAYFVIDGVTVIDLKISELIVLTFNLPATTPSAFFSTNLVANLAALLGVTEDKIRRVNIISANNSTRVRRQVLLSTIQLRVELRDEPVANLSNPGTSNISDINCRIINRYQSGQLQADWSNLTNGSAPTSLVVQEPGNQTNSTLSVIDRIILVTPPSGCRLQSPCDVQPVIVAYDTLGKVISKLGANDQPWQVSATVVSPSGVTVIGGLANYTNGQTQYSLFGLSSTGSVQVKFTFVTPFGVSSSYVADANLTVTPPSSLTVTNAVLAAQQSGDINVVSVNSTFNLSAIIVDKSSKKKIGNIVWGSFTWRATASMYTDVQYRSNGTLLSTNQSTVIVDTTAGTITVTFLSISEPGMYIIKLQLTSTDNVYSIVLASNAILVKKATTQLSEYTGFPPSNITFNGDYYELQANERLEIIRCAIYNYLTRKVGMPLKSQLVLTAGSVVAGFDADTSTAGNAQITQIAVITVSNNPNDISGLEVRSININGATYSRSASDSSSTYDQVSNTGLIVGPIVGIFCGLLLIAGIVYGYKTYYNKQRGRRLINDEPGDLESPRTNQSSHTYEMIPPTNSNENTLTRHLSTPTSDTTHLNINRAHTPLSNAPPPPPTEQRVPSAAMSTTTLGDLAPIHSQPTTKPSATAHLIRFD